MRKAATPVREIQADTLGLNRSQLPKHVLSLLKVLHDQNYAAHIVGGGVRDLLLEKHPADFDIATDARPEQVRKLFKRCRIIGRRFRLAHVYSGKHIIEVATFRDNLSGKNDEKTMRSDEGRILRNNVYGTLEEDAYRRDFIANSIYYDPLNEMVHCHPQAVDDIKARRLTIIGDPDKSYREDPVRMLRAVRLATRLGMTLDKATEAAIPPNAALLKNESPARLYEEFNKLFHAGAAVAAFDMLRTFDLLQYMFPLTDAILKENETDSMYEDFLYIVLSNTDERVATGKAVVPAFILTGLLWFDIESRMTSAVANGEHLVRAIEMSFEQTMRKQAQALSIPKYCGRMMLDVCRMQWQLTARRPKILSRLVSHPKFRAGYDFFCLRAKAGLSDESICEWWTRYQEANEPARTVMLKEYSRKQFYA